MVLSECTAMPLLKECDEFEDDIGDMLMVFMGREHVVKYDNLDGKEGNVSEDKYEMLSRMLNDRLKQQMMVYRGIVITRPSP